VGKHLTTKLKRSLQDRRRIVYGDLNVTIEVKEQSLQVLMKGILECMELEKAEQVARRVLASFSLSSRFRERRN
jgi:hypothetical protein